MNLPPPPTANTIQATQQQQNRIRATSTNTNTNTNTSAHTININIPIDIDIESLARRLVVHRRTNTYESEHAVEEVERGWDTRADGERINVFATNARIGKSKDT
jgi:hypothetical protein